MSVVLVNCFPGHSVTTYTRTTTVNSFGAYTTTDSSDSFEYGANKWGQVGVKIDFVNDSEKTIKYVFFTVAPYNQVGDQIRDRHNGRSAVTLSVTGPIKPNAYEKYTWNYVWDSHTISDIEVTQIEILYSDGSQKTMNTNQIYYDEALARSKKKPLVLAILLILAVAWSWYAYTSMAYCCIPLIIMILSTIGTMHFSRCKRNAKGTAVCSIICFGSVFLCPILAFLFGINLKKLLGVYALTLLLVTTIISLLFMLCGTGVIRQTWKKRKTMNIAVTIGVISSIWVWPDGAVVFFLWLLMCLTAKRLRYRYPKKRKRIAQ